MTDKPYTTVLSTALALAGIPDSNAEEVARMGVFINLAAEKAYDESDQWPRWLRVEERVCSEDGLLPFEEEGLETIAVCRRIHATEPYARCGAVEYPDYVATAGGIQIAGYCPREVSDDRAPMLVSGTFSPNLNGTYRYTGQGPTGADETTTAPEYQSESNEDNTLAAVLLFTLGTPPVLTGYRWSLRGTSGTDYWRSDSDIEYTTPDVASGTYVAQGAAFDTGVTITKIDTYSAWVTYKAAMDVTYGAEVGGHAGAGITTDVPAEWWKYMAYSAYAMFLRNDGQQEKAAMADAEAWGYLVPQLEKLDNQSGGHVFTRRVSHGGAQAR